MSYILASTNEIEILETETNECSNCDFDKSECEKTSTLIKGITHTETAGGKCENSNGFVYFKIRVWEDCTSDNIVVGGKVRRHGNLIQKTITYIPKDRTTFMIDNSTEVYDTIGKYKILVE